MNYRIPAEIMCNFRRSIFQNSVLIISGPECIVLRHRTIHAQRHQQPYARHAVRQFDSRQGAAIIKRRLPYARHTVRQLNGRQGTATRKRTKLNLLNSLRNFIGFLLFSNRITDQGFLRFVKENTIDDCKNRLFRGNLYVFQRLTTRK